METQAGTVDRRLQHLLAYAYGGVLTNRWPPPREAKSWLILPSGVYPCKDGFLQVLSFPQWLPRYAQAMGMPELVDDPRFQNVLNREYAGEFDAIWYSWLIDHTKTEAFKVLREAKIAAAPVNSPEDLLRDPHLKARKYFVEIDRPETGKLTYPGAPFKMSETPWRVRRPAPLLGEHNEEIYCKLLGYARNDLVKLSKARII
jgi:crotonobetainyl-CoA:carnitine CoA-transferase CaiB-like acyl-CoA transferase